MAASDVTDSKQHLNTYMQPGKQIDEMSRSVAVTCELAQQLKCACYFPEFVSFNQSDSNTENVTEEPVLALPGRVL